MRNIPLTVRPPVDGSPFPGHVNDRNVLKQVVSMPTNGLTLEGMRRGLKILDALDAADGTIELADAQWEFLCDCIRNFRWAVADQRFLALSDSVLNAPET